ncbi:MAG: ribosome-associated translation inhibitor RaiA [Ectothiorhodospiraceae bacterium]|nr:ribosome-associated translation inhibitor RaiA [Ectothiorhodospiraceae bacterium]
MQINVTGHHVEVTPALREYVQNKTGRLERHHDHATSFHVVLTVERQKHRAEATMHLAGNRLFADASANDMYAAVDAMMDKLDRQLRRHKEKVTDHHRAEGGLKTMEE